MGPRWIVALSLAACSFRPSNAPSDGSSGSGRGGTTPDSSGAAAFVDCKDAFGHGIATSGPQSIDPDGPGGNPPFTAYCDMTTAGGGWTLAWVYGFTAYDSFSDGSNAVTPRPTWGIPASGTRTPTSTTVPTGPTTPGALDFARWTDLGPDFLVVSNINHVISCRAGSGSLVTLTPGTVSCQVVRNVAPACPNSVPDEIHTDDPAGVGLYIGPDPLATYYFWDGWTQTDNWPTHDPCGTNSENQAMGVASPFGSIYLRRP